MSDQTPAGKDAPQLREMKIGALLDAAIKLYRANFKLFAGITALVMVPYLTLQALVAQSFSGTPTTPGSISGGMVAGAIVSGLLGLGLFFLVTPFLTGAVARATSDIYLGDSPSVGEIGRFAWANLGSILLVGILTGLAVTGGFLLLIVPGIIFILRFYFGTAVVVVEGLKGRAAMRRSWRLTKGSTGKIFSTLFLAGILTTIARAILELPVAALGFIGAKGLFTFLGNAVATVITSPFPTIATVLIYFDTRIRKEGFDLTLMAQELGQPPV